MFICQTKYAPHLLQSANMLDAKPCSTPIAMGQKLDISTGSPLSYPMLYRSLVGTLQYLTWSRPDLSYVVQHVSQFMQRPTSTHFTAVKRILRYVKSTLDSGIWLTKGPLALHAYLDSDWAGSPFDHKSTIGYTIFLGTNLISWQANKQAIVSRSSTESEYRSLAHTAAELSWICHLFKDLSLPLPTTPSLFYDIISSIAIAQNPVLHARTKYIEVDFHFIRDLVTKRLLDLSYICTDD